VTIPGAPHIIGKTDYMAVGVTTIYCDTIDLYKEHIEGDKYLVEGQWRDLKQREEIIKVKGKDGMREEKHIVR
jgi:penicillin amidase